MSTYIPPVDSTATQHEGTGSLAIKNTLIRRVLVLLALKTIARLSSYNRPCTPISSGLIVKWGPYVHLTEAATMQFIAANTSVPVPRVHCAFVHNNIAYITMERIQGVAIGSVRNGLSREARENLLTQLRNIFQELRSLQPPRETGVQSSCGGPLRDSRIPRSRPRFGPFKTTHDFHLWLREGLQPEEHPEKKGSEGWEDIEKMVMKQDQHCRPSVFTHGDLNPSNILVRGDRVVGIIDWEFSGWYPDYWEYTSAWLGNRLFKRWQEEIPGFLDVYPEELEMEITRTQWWGDF